MTASAITNATVKVAPREQAAPAQAPREGEQTAPGFGRRMMGMMYGLARYTGIFLMIFAVYAGWKIRAREIFTAETGVGYALGIIGAGLMVLLMGYPARKRYRFMSGWGQVKYWFQIHMVLGVIGPICILFHANFSLGSLNSNVALFCMLAVAGSGIVGRYIYTQVHYGLYGRRATLAEWKRQLENDEHDLIGMLGPDSAVRKALLDSSKRMLDHPPGVIRGALYALIMPVGIFWKASRLKGKLRREIRAMIAKNPKKTRDYRLLQKKVRAEIWLYLKHLRKVSVFNFYERLLSLWHQFHMPLMIMMFITGIFHVYAVHAF